jgi:hypothetical protein
MAPVDFFHVGRRRGVGDGSRVGEDDVRVGARRVRREGAGDDLAAAGHLALGRDRDGAQAHGLDRAEGGD